MNITWITGWAVAPKSVERFAHQHLPDSKHHIVSPTRNAVASILETPEMDCIIGHSLGAFLVVLNPELARKAKQSILLAPFLNYRREAGLGSRVSLTQLKLLKRWLGNKPVEAVTDFYQRAQLDDCELDGLPYSIDELLWGIDVLINEAGDCLNLENVLLCGGAKDPLLDFTRIQQLLPSLEIIPNANHRLEGFANIIAKHAL